MPDKSNGDSDLYNNNIPGFDVTELVIAMAAGLSLCAMFVGTASNRSKACLHDLWQSYFENPMDWWDNRCNKLHPKSPDFRHKCTKEPLWIDDWNTPEWVREALERKKISIKAARSRFESDINIHGECGPDNAVHLKLDERDEQFWTELILQYSRCGQGRQALRMYEDMLKDGVEPSSRTFLALLKVCSSLRDLETAKRIHTEVKRHGFQSDLYVGTMLVDVYAKCRSLMDARLAFEEMPCRDVVSWTAMIFGYAQMGKGEEALQLFGQMQREGVVPDTRTYLSVLKACSSLAGSREKNEGDSKVLKTRCLETVRAIHTDIVNGKFESRVFLGTMLVDVYAKCGSLEEARRVFEKMPHRDVVSWNAMILGYAQMNKPEDALELYTQMQMEGVVPDDRTYVSVLKACSNLAASDDRNGSGGMFVKSQCLETVRAIHVNVRKGKFELDEFVGNMLVDVYAKCGSLEDARRVFEKMPNRTVVSWTAMIFGYVQMNEGELALQLYIQMQQEGIVPNDRTYVSALKACCSLIELEERCESDVAAVKKRCLEMVRSIHTDIVRRKLESDIFVGTMLVDAYAKCGNLEDARHVFETLPHRDTVSWNAMILGYMQMDKGEDALQLYTLMQHEGVVADGLTNVAALKACGSLAAIEKGKEIHANICKAGLEGVDSFVANSLIDMYGKCGSMVDAEEVFDALSIRDVVAWSSLIAGYAHQGNSEAVFNLFRRMKQAGVRPDGITFLGVLTVCSHVGLVDQGQEYFESMSRDYGLTPRIKHFTCMVDLLGRLGQLKEAMEIVELMPSRPDTALWECVLGACRKWGDVELGRQAFNCAVSLNEDNAAAYNLMSNIYLAVHMWEEANEIEAMRVKSGAWKQPGWSRWTDVRGNVHMFVVGDQEHPESRDIHAKLGDVMAGMKNEGSVPLPLTRHT